MQPRKILLTTPYDLNVSGGVNTQLWLLYRELCAGGKNRVKILAPSSASDKPVNRDVVVCGKVTPVSMNGSVARYTLDPRIYHKVKKMMGDFSPHVIHLQEPLAPLLNYAVLKYSKAKNVGTFHSFSDGRGYDHVKPFLNPLFRKLHVKIAVSKAAGDFAAQSFPGRYHIIPNGIPLCKDVPDKLFQDGKKNILFVGRLNEPRKGFRYLWKAYRELEAKHPGKYRLLVAGSGGESLEKSSCRGEVVPLGMVSDEELRRLYASCDVLCAPSTGGESFGIVLLEAFAFGKPVVASRIKGYDELMLHNQTGLLVPPKDELALAGALQTILEDGKRYDEMSRFAKERVRQYDFRKIARRISLFYDMLCPVVASMPDTGAAAA